MSTIPTVSAPASVQEAQSQSLASLASLLTNLAPGLAQSQTDATTLNNLLASWPTDVDVALKPLAQILVRVIDYEAQVAQGIQDILTALQAI